MCRFDIPDGADITAHDVTIYVHSQMDITALEDTMGVQRGALGHWKDGGTEYNGKTLYSTAWHVEQLATAVSFAQTNGLRYVETFTTQYDSADAR